MREVLPQLLEWWRAGETVGVGTVVATFRSAPRPPGASMLVGPDGTAFFCEDGHDRNFVRALGADGRVFDFARNAHSRSELAGVCFSPDGGAMFVNLQSDGLTLAITGPFRHA